MKVVKVLKTTLKSGLSASAASISVQKFVDSNNEEVALADFGTYFIVVIKQAAKIEIVKCSAVTQSASTTDTSAILTVDTNGRNIPPKSPFTGSSTGKTFTTGAELIITNDPLTMSLFAQLAEDNAFTGDNTFTEFPKKLGSTTAVDDEDFITLAHLNATVLGDAVVSALKSSVTAGEDLTDGQPVYFKESDGKWWRAYANDSATCVGVLLGIADADILTDATGVIVRLGRKASLTGLTVGENYLTDAGGISTTAGSYVTHLGTALSATVLTVAPKDGDREEFLSTVTGMLVPFAGTSVPSGFLACNGALLNFTDQPDLLSVIGVKYGLGAATAFTTTFANDTIDITSHGFSNGTQFILSSTGTLPAGWVAETIYYVVEATTNTFKLSLTEGGTAAAITDDGTGTHNLHTQFRLPDLRGSVVIGSGQKVVTFDFLDADVVVGTDTITVDSNDFLQSGQAVTLTTSGVLPTGLSATTYYVVNVSATSIKLSTSRANVDDDIVVDITAAAGGGTHTLTATLTSRTHGESGGEEFHTISTEELASHNHRAQTNEDSSFDGHDGGGDNATYALGYTGGDEPHNNMQPYVVANWIIKK